MPFLQHDLPSNSSFSIVDIEAGLDKLKNLKSVGPDGLSGIYLYNIRNSISFPLLLLFRRSLDERVYPSIWKMSCVSPIHKSGGKSDVKNYRPISILSHLAKLFDSLVLQSIQPSVNSILIDEQHGFRPGRSTITNSMIFNKYIFEAFEENFQVDTIYTDLSKAFDRVDHSALVQVLFKTGFGDPLLSWFRSYLSDRLQWIKTNGFLKLLK